MPKMSIRERLEKLEDKRRFLDWFVRHRLYSTEGTRLRRGKNT